MRDVAAVDETMKAYFVISEGSVIFHHFSKCLFVHSSIFHRLITYPRRYKKKRKKNHDIRFAGIQRLPPSFLRKSINDGEKREDRRSTDSDLAQRWTVVRASYDYFVPR